MPLSVIFVLSLPPFPRYSFSKLRSQPRKFNFFESQRRKKNPRDKLLMNKIIVLLPLWIFPVKLITIMNPFVILCVVTGYSNIASQTEPTTQIERKGERERMRDKEKQKEMVWTSHDFQWHYEKWNFLKNWDQKIKSPQHFRYSRSIEKYEEWVKIY